MATAVGNLKHLLRWDVQEQTDNNKRGAVKDQLEALIMQMYKSGITYSEGVCEFKKKFILTVLQDCKGNQCKAARQLGMHRNTLSRTIAELGSTSRNCAAASAARRAAPTPSPWRRKPSANGVPLCPLHSGHNKERSSRGCPFWWFAFSCSLFASCGWKMMHRRRSRDRIAVLVQQDAIAHGHHERVRRIT